MTPLVKRIIIIANIVLYVCIGTGIYIKKKGGFKELAPHKKLIMSEVAVMGKRNTAGETTTRIAKISEKKPVGMKPAKKPEAKPATVKATPAVNPALLAQLPPHIKETNKLLEEMKIKEKTLNFSYFAGMHRDPFMPLIGVDKFLSGLKLTADELADLPFGIPEQGKKKTSPFTLMGTVISQTREPTAIVNDQLLYKGDMIDGYEVKEISGKKVVLKKGKREIKLEMPDYESEAATIQK